MVDQDTVKFLSFRFTLGFLAMTLILLLKIQKVDYKKGFIGLIFLCGLFNPAISQILETTSTSYAPTSPDRDVQQHASDRHADLFRVDQ